MTPTKAQVEALRWLVGRGRTEQLDSTALYPLYESKSTLRPHAMRVVAWKRVSGSNMARMKRDGLLDYDFSIRGTNRFYYKLTELGTEAARV